MQNSKRNGKDGIVLFGYERKKENNSENNININSETNDESTVKDFLFNDFIFPIEGNYDYKGIGIYSGKLIRIPEKEFTSGQNLFFRLPDAEPGGKIYLGETDLQPGGNHERGRLPLRVYGAEYP